MIKIKVFWQTQRKLILKILRSSILMFWCFDLRTSDGGIEVSMVAFQAVDPGSIPGHRNFNWIWSCFLQKESSLPGIEPGIFCFPSLSDRRQTRYPLRHRPRKVWPSSWKIMRQRQQNKKPLHVYTLMACQKLASSRVKQIYWRSRVSIPVPFAC